MPVDHIQVGGSNPTPDRQDFNLVAGTGIAITAADDSTNNVSKATIALGAVTGTNGADFSGGSGAFKTSTGASTFGGSSNTFTNSLGSVGGQATAGSFGAPLIVAAAQDVASTGASTTLLTFASPTSGLYRVTIVVSAHTNTDTVTATVTYTDAVEAFATTLTPISAVALTHDSNTGTTASTSIIRASAATSIVATLSVTGQTTTKASVVIERLN